MPKGNNMSYIDTIDKLRNNLDTLAEEILDKENNEVSQNETVSFILKTIIVESKNRRVHQEDLQNEILTVKALMNEEVLECLYNLLNVHLYGFSKELNDLIEKRKKEFNI